MTQSLPPWTLVKTWLDIIQQKDIPPFVKQKRQTLIDYYFGSTEFADMYVEQHQYSYQKVS